MKKNFYFFTAIILIIGLFSVNVLSAQESDVPVMKVPDNLLGTLKTWHPRLHLDVQGFADLKLRIESDSTLRGWYVGIVKKGEAILKELVAVYVIPDGLRLLNTSRKIVDRHSVLGFLYQI